MKGCFETMFERIQYKLTQKHKQKKKERHELFQEYFNKRQLSDDEEEVNNL